MNQLSIIKRILIWAAGYDSVIATHCTSSEVKKICVAGSMVFIPAFVALFSYSYSFNFFFHNQQYAIVGGVVSAIVILLIDRAIMAYGRPGKFSIGLLGRVVFAIIVGFLLGEPMTLKIFEDAIQEQQFGELSAEKSRITNEYNAQIQALRQGLVKDTQHLFELQDIARVESDGTGGSGQKNFGPIYAKKNQDYLDFKAVYDAEVADINNKIADAESAKQTKLRLVESSNADGLIGRMRALDTLGKTEPIVFYATWLIRIFFTLIELLPLLIKISPTGDRGLYHTIVDINDEEREQTFKSSSEHRMQVQKQQEKLLYNLEYIKLLRKETEAIANGKAQDSYLLMEKAFEMSKKKMQEVDRVYRTIPDEELQDLVINHIEKIHNGYMEVVESLLNKSNKNYLNFEIN